MKPRTREQADVALSIFALPPIVGGSLDFDDAVALAEGQLVILGGIVATENEVVQNLIKDMTGRSYS